MFRGGEGTGRYRERRVATPWELRPAAMGPGAFPQGHRGTASRRDAAPTGDGHVAGAQSGS